MDRSKIIVLSFLLLFFSSPPLALAHVLESDGSVGAVMHITPDDDPIAGEQSGFFFEFKDRENKFTPEQCSCTFSVLQAGKTIYTQPLFQTSTEPSLTDISIFYTFPEKNIYTIQVTGKPTTPNAFQPFTLTYDLRVEKEADAQGTASEQNSIGAWIERHTFHIMGAIILLGLVSYSFYTNQLKKRR